MSYEKKPHKKGNWQKKEAKPTSQSQRFKQSPLMTEEQKQNANIQDLSYDFACRITRLFQYLTDSVDYRSSINREFIISKQVTRSGTSIGANTREAQHAQSDADFLSKMSIALKECDESQYWLSLLHDNGYISDIQYSSLDSDVQRLLRLLQSITKSTRQKIERSKAK